MRTSNYRYFALWRGVGWLIVAAIAVFSLTPQQPDIGGLEINDKLGHSIAYAIGMGWFAALYPSMRQRVGYAVFFMLLGIALEFAQSFTPNRQLELLDMVADGIGVAAGFVLGQPVLPPLDRTVARLVGKPVTRD